MYTDVSEQFIPTHNGIEPAKITIYSEAIDKSVVEIESQLRDRFELPFIIYEGRIELVLFDGFDPEIAFPRITNVVNYVKDMENDRNEYKKKNMQLKEFVDSLNQPTER